MCTFPVCDLDVHGESCPVVVAVMDVAAPAVSRAAVRDLFVFLDFRPLGFKPRFLYTNVPTVHLPSLLARFGIELPPVYRIGVYGGTRQGDEVHIDGHATLLFHFLEAASVASNSSEISEDEAAASAPDSPDDLLYNGPPAVSPASSTQPFEDTTLPAGHSWNAAHGPQNSLCFNARQSCFEDATADDPPPWDVVLATYEAVCTAPLEWAGAAAPPTLTMLPDVRARAISTASSPVPLPPSAPPTPAEAPTSILTFVFAPDFVPDIICLCLHLPAAVASFLTAVQAHRTGSWHESFPKLVPVMPQPCEEFAVCVAAPDWVQDRAIVLIDSRRMDDRIFAVSVPIALSRESIIIAAGYSHDAPVRVYVHGLMQPLAVHQRITLFTGMTVTVSPNIIGAPATFDLGTRLQTMTDWNPNAAFPCAQAYPGSHFYILTDGLPKVFAVRPFRRASFGADLAQLLQCEEHSLFVRASKPRFTDLYVLGQLVSGVLVATDRLSTLPCPPARTVETRVLLLLDQRRILKGITWRVLEHPFVPVQSLANEYYEHCPPDHIVSIRGAAVENRPDGPVLLISSGQVLTIEFIEDLRPDVDDDPDMHPPGDPGRDDCGPEGGPDGHRPQTTGTSPGQQPSVTAAADITNRNRSRSPRQAPPSCALVSHQSRTALCQCDRALCAKLACDRVAMCPDVQHQDALLQSRHPCTPVLSHAQTCGQCSALRIKAALVSHGSYLPLAVYKLLHDPAQGNTNANITAQGARDAARMLGVRWPATPELPLWFPDVDDESDPAGTSQDGNDIIEASFCLFTPDYHPEVLPLHIAIPQTFLDLCNLLQTCRNRAHAVLFPRLIEIWPQPSDAWGALLAVPDWQDRLPVICVDCTALDGRLFTAVAPIRVARRQLLQLAGLSPAADADVFLPDMLLPLDDDSEVPLWTGLCVRLLIRGHFPPVSFSLREMLRSTRHWAARPRLEFLDVAEHYCIVTNNGQRAFRLLPHRASYYSADLAAQFGYAPEDMHFQPACPLVVNATVFGRSCRTVVVLDDRPVSPWEEEPVSGFLDCRPLLLGWLPLLSDRGWVDIGLLRDALTQSAPPEWAASFQDFPDHWTWTWIEPGQVIIAYFVQHGPRAPMPLITPVIQRPISANSEQLNPAHGRGPADRAGPADPGGGDAGHDQAHGTGASLETMDAIVAVPFGGARLTQPIFACAPPDGDRHPLLVLRRRSHSHSARQCRGRPGAPPLLFVGVLFSTCHLNRAVPLFGATTTRPVVHEGVGDISVPPPLHVTSQLSATGSSTTTWPCGPTAVKLPQPSQSLDSLFPCGRPVPTPCRGLPRPMDVTYLWHLEVLDTLLDESAHETSDWAFLATTLLEALGEHLGAPFPAPASSAPTHAPFTAAVAPAPCAAAVSAPPISLEACLPLSIHQQQCLDLEKALPHEIPLEQHDWLDSDLSEVLRFEGLSLDVRTQLVNVNTWHHAGCPPADRLLVFTDGSASSDPSDIGPCAWAFAVFVVSGCSTLLLGHSSGQSVPPDTPFYLGGRCSHGRIASPLLGTVLGCAIRSYICLQCVLSVRRAQCRRGHFRGLSSRWLSAAQLVYCLSAVRGRIATIHCSSHFRLTRTCRRP